MTMLDVAVRYTRRGWRVVPVPHRSKNPGFSGWQQLRLEEVELQHHFNGRPQNIGVLLGEPSDWLVDVDLDHPRAVALADQFLPPTPAVFGRPSKRRSHWLYRVSAPLVTKKFRSKSAGMIVEVRSTGAQTVLPPSTHEKGEAICWEDKSAEPAIVDPQELLDAAKLLADTVLAELGERKAPAKRTERTLLPSAAPPLPADPPPDDVRAARCLAAMLRMHMIDQNDGSSRLFAAACRVVEFDLNDRLALATIRQYARQRPFPTDWLDEQVFARIRDAEKTCQRGQANEPVLSDDGLIALGGRDPATGKLVLSPRRTLPTAEAFVREFHAHPDGRTLVSQGGVLLRWTGNRYVELEDGGVKRQLQGWLHGALRYVFNRGKGEHELAPFDSNPATVNAALETVRAHVHLSATIATPSWLSPDRRPPASEILPCRSVLLHLPTMRRLKPTPLLFTTNALEFDPAPDAPEPYRWHAFLHQLFDGDVQALELLQEWFGLCLTANTAFQKMLLVVGPRRCGKGTLARVLTRLVGQANVSGPTTSSLAGDFGLHPLVGKTLAIVSDARFHGERIATVVERLLCISGEDAISIDRKFLPSITLKLPTRFMFLSNEVPRLSDTSGALAGRFLILRLTQSFYGREDTELTPKLLAELPGILNWAIEGWRRLHARGHFVMPDSSNDYAAALEDLASPVGAFVRHECLIGGTHRARLDALYAAWQRWCDREGRTHRGSRQAFGRDLAAAEPTLVCRRNHADGRFYEGIALKANADFEDPELDS